MTRATASLANESWEALLHAHAALIKRLQADEVWVEVSMREYDVLYTLSKCVAPIRLGELQRHVLLSQPALSRMVDRLADRGLVLREVDPIDARGVLLSLAPAGIEVQQRTGRRHARDVAEVMAARLSEEEMARLADLCLRLAGDDQ